MKKNDASALPGTATVTVSTDVYPLEAVLGAAYVFLDRAYIRLDRDDERTIVVTLKAKAASVPRSSMDAIEGEFLNELLNYAHRLHIAKRNQGVRERIVERALFGALPEDAQGDPTTPLDDPLGIAVPWEEKYGDAKDGTDV